MPFFIGLDLSMQPAVDIVVDSRWPHGSKDYASKPLEFAPSS